MKSRIICKCAKIRYNNKFNSDNHTDVVMSKNNMEIYKKPEI
jgi:hypothetical protein